ncbi:MAG: ribbon-helix-helix protein, CopG family [Deltaproteobacteria bacterium]|nr:ribbon-helix-helix protein, CopG family [Deltaproteobacteria bacterium]
MSDFTLDVDREAVHMDGSWYTADELAKKVTEMLGAKDFKIGTAASALEALQAALADVRDIGFRLPGTMLEALESTAGREGRTTSAILRDALQAYLDGGGAPAAVPAPAALEPAPAEVAPAPAAGVTVESLSVSEADAAGAVTLTAKKPDSGNAGALDESGWFEKK